MAINVTFGTGRINILDADDNLINTIAYQAVDTISLTTDPNPSVTANTLGGDVTPTTDPQLYVVLWVRDRRMASIELGNVDNQPTWTNDEDGYENAVTDIYAAINA